jgi:hypothetical protein
LRTTTGFMVSSHEGRFDTLPMKGEGYGDSGKTRVWTHNLIQ